MKNVLYPRGLVLCNIRQMYNYKVGFLQLITEVVYMCNVITSILDKIFHFAGLQHNIQFGMCVHQRYKSVCTSTKSDLSLNVPPEVVVDPWLPIKHQ